MDLVLTLRKPVVLFYNFPLNQEISTNIKLNQGIWKFSYVLPLPTSVLTDSNEYNWKFTFKGELNLLNEQTNKSFPYLFWEANPTEGSSMYLNEILKTNYFCFAKDEALDKIDTLLKLKGLNVT